MGKIELNIYTKDGCVPCTILKRYIHSNKVKIDLNYELSLYGTERDAKKVGVKSYPTAFFDGVKIVKVRDIIDRLEEGS